MKSGFSDRTDDCILEHTFRQTVERERERKRETVEEPCDCCSLCLYHLMPSSLECIQNHISISISLNFLKYIYISYDTFHKPYSSDRRPYWLSLQRWHHIQCLSSRHMHSHSQPYCQYKEIVEIGSNDINPVLQLNVSNDTKVSNSFQSITS